MSASKVIGNAEASPTASPTRRAREGQRMNRTAQLLCIACGPLMITLFVIGSILIARFFPPAIHPQWDARHVAEYYAAHTTRIRIGMVISCCAYGLMATWGERTWSGPGPPRESGIPSCSPSLQRIAADALGRSRQRVHVHPRRAAITERCPAQGCWGRLFPTARESRILPLRLEQRQLKHSRRAGRYAQA